MNRTVAREPVKYPRLRGLHGRCGRGASSRAARMARRCLRRRCRRLLTGRPGCSWPDADLEAGGDAPATDASTWGGRVGPGQVPTRKCWHDRDRGGPDAEEGRSCVAGLSTRGWGPPPCRAGGRYADRSPPRTAVAGRHRKTASRRAGQLDGGLVSQGAIWQSGWDPDQRRWSAVGDGAGRAADGDAGGRSGETSRDPEDGKENP
jgi:hypothetical protein